MSGRIRCVEDVVKWDLCTGCGACRYFSPGHVTALQNDYNKGIRPVTSPNTCDTNCLAVCPGYRLDQKVLKPSEKSKTAYLVGPHTRIFEGYALDRRIRHKASSGGILTAVAQYCLEKEDMDFVLHTGMNRTKPWENETVVSKTKKDLIEHAGSRYNTSSPCEGLEYIENAKKKCIFIGKPCDVAALNKARKVNTKLNRNIGLVLTFFCAGTPSTNASLQLLKEMNAGTKGMKSLRYRGNGWPGGFRAEYELDRDNVFVSYEDSWSRINKERPLRCFLCPDGLGEFADISSGDAWHRRTADESDGISIILPRTAVGTNILERAAKAGYIYLEDSNIENLLKAQPLIERRKLIFGRLAGMRLVGFPIPKYRGFSLFRAWIDADAKEKIKSLAYWRRVFLLRRSFKKKK